MRPGELNGNMRKDTKPDGMPGYASSVDLYTHICVFMPYLELVCFGFPVLKKCRGIRRSSVTNSESACKHGRIFM